MLWSYLTLFVVVQSHSHVRLFATPCPAACQASLSLTISQSLPCINSTSNWKQFKHSNSYLGSDCLLCLKCLLFFFLNPSIYGEGNVTPLQYSCLENPMDGGAWWAAVHGIAKSRTQLSNFTIYLNTIVGLKVQSPIVILLIRKYLGHYSSISTGEEHSTCLTKA